MKRYDDAYFRQWYHDPATRVRSAEDLERRVRMVVTIAEQLLERPMESMLDVGCGEGAWSVVLRKLRPMATYTGIDGSEYVVSRFGRARNIRLGAFGELASFDFEDAFDVVVCSDVLHYLSGEEIDRGLPPLATLTRGIAYLSLFTREDDPGGDLAGWHKRNASWYRQRFARAGLSGCGMQCYVTEVSREAAAALDLL
ncbi:MAG TPA: class I SAM-dependent methyltransferase [Thermoanaerobaculia bacterium]|nr:class I SAM-dependent methyltransferase [Thermoanaerobaculia bacterium]